jgi:hypothetical protein
LIETKARAFGIRYFDDLGEGVNPWSDELRNTLSTALYLWFRHGFKIIKYWLSCLFIQEDARNFHGKNIGPAMV